MPARPALVSAPPQLDLTVPEDVGLSAAQLARIDDHLRRRYLAPEKIAGCLTLVARGGKPAYLSAQGLMDRERGRPMRTDTIFRIYSMTKPGGGGLVSTAHDYYRFCQMMLNGESLEGAHILGRKSVELMTMNHLPGGRDLTELAVGAFSETTYEGVGFGLGVSVTLDLAVAQTIGSVGEYGWGGAASTAYWIDPKEDLIVIFMVQFWMSGTFNFRGQLKSIVYPALT